MAEAAAAADEQANGTYGTARVFTWERLRACWAWSQVTTPNCALNNHLFLVSTGATEVEWLYAARHSVSRVTELSKCDRRPVISSFTLIYLVAHPNHEDDRR